MRSSLKLTDKTHWSQTWKLIELNEVERRASPRSATRFSSYKEHLFWDVLFDHYIPKVSEATALEIGSAPGDFLVRLSERYGYVPYGIEWTQQGAELNRQLFQLHNIDPNNVINADFLSEEIHQAYKDRFDLVISNGFVEHFDNPRDIVNKHLNLLKEGGVLIVLIPNQTGANGLVRRFHSVTKATHNFDIMRLREFIRLFDEKRLNKLFCSYYGTFDITWTFPVPVLKTLLGLTVQPILNLAFRVVLKQKGWESRLFSPHLVYIGIKRAT
jgi:SAM-dependent methyltransferase